jgi:hypothetical protein
VVFWIGKKYPSIAKLLTLGVGLLFVSCSEPPERLQYKLHASLQEDLKFIVAEIKRGSGNRYLLDTPYFVIDEMRFYQGDSARKIAAYANVNYFYFNPDSISLYQNRKYVYDTKNRFWDRKFKDVRHMGQLKKK